MGRFMHRVRGMPRWLCRSLLGLFLLAAFAAWQLAGLWGTGNWRQTDGVVTRSEIRQFRAGDELLYYLRVRYRYAVDGVTRTGHRATTGDLLDATRLDPLLNEDRGWQSWWARRFPIPRADTPHAFADLTARYPAGQPVAVYYDPRDPARAALAPAADWRWLPPLLVLVALTLVAGIGVWTLTRALRSKRAGPLSGSPGKRTARWRRLLLILGLLGLGVTACSYHFERRVLEEPPPAVALTELCSADNRAALPRWVTIHATVPTAPRWSPTGLIAPEFAACPSEAVVSLAPGDLTVARLTALLGCQVELAGTGSHIETLDFGTPRVADEAALGRYQQMHRIAGVETSVWTLSRRHSGDMDGTRKLWRGRLIRTTDLRSNRPVIEPEWTTLRRQLQESPFSILSDEAVPVPALSPSLYTAGDCAVVTIPPELEERLDGETPDALAWKVRWFPNSRNWPEPAVASARPLLLRAASDRAYAQHRTFRWRRLRDLGLTMALFGLVPVLHGALRRL